MRKNVHNTSGIRVHITGAFRNYGKNGAPMEEYFGKKLRTHQSEMDEGCHHCKKYGYQLIVKEYGKNPQQAKKLVRNVGQAQSGTILQSGLVQMESVN